MKAEELSFYQNFLSRSDLSKYGDNALLLYSLQIKYALEDIDEVATNCLLDGSDDKKIDLVYIDLELNEAVIAQGYFCKKDKISAPSNKASDLNVAIGWLLTRKISELPDRLQSAAQEIRRRINDGEIKKISLWYSHNLPESENVKEELQTAENTLAAIIKTHFKNANIESCSLEVGINTLEDWYQGLTIPILINDKIILKDCEGYSLKGTDWDSFNTYFPAKKLYRLFKQHGTRLFSANVRDYLGSRKSDSNINNGIKYTAETEPGNFFIYNNGITALVNNFRFNRSNKTLNISGFSIVNGAQTTGAVCSLNKSPDRNIFISIKLIKCNNPDTISQIVKYNNSQNKINAPDFRSGDKVQKRLTLEFKELNVIEYSSRRGGALDIIKRNPNLLPSITAGQILAAFHSEPGIAYNEKSKIWDSDKLYATFFNEHTTSKHIYFIYTLLRAIEDLKLSLMNKSDLTVSEQSLLSYLRSRGAIVLLISAISECFEEILNKPVPNKFSLQFKNKISVEQAKVEWKSILNVISPFTNQLKHGLSDGIKNREKIKLSIENFKQMVGAIKVANTVTFSSYARKIKN